MTLGVVLGGANVHDVDIALLHHAFQFHRTGGKRHFGLEIFLGSGGILHHRHRHTLLPFRAPQIPACARLSRLSNLQTSDLRPSAFNVKSEVAYCTIPWGT